MNEQTIEHQPEEVSFSFICEISDESLEAAGGTSGGPLGTMQRGPWCPGV
jgi:hypothetical protein